MDVCEASEGPFPAGLTGEDWAGEGKQVYGLPRRYDDMRNRFNGRKCMAQAVSVKTKQNITTTKTQGELNHHGFRRKNNRCS